MNDYKPMTTLKQVRQWARANGLVMKKILGPYGGLFYTLHFNQKQISPSGYKEKFILEANALRQWHEENRKVVYIDDTRGLA